MKRYELDLTNWEITYQKQVPSINDKGVMEGYKNVDQQEVYPFRNNLNVWLRTAGIFKTANDIAEAVTLAKAIAACKDDKYVMDEQEAKLLRIALDKFIELTAEGRATIGGVIHEEAILRVVNMKEIEG